VKRKVKFQEGGAVEEPARRPARESARNRQLRETMEKFGREGRRVRTSERLQKEATTRRGAARGAGAPNFTTDPEGTTRRGAATGREMVPAREVVPATRSVGGDVGPTRPTMQQAMTRVTRPPIPLGRVRPPVGGLPAVAGAVAAEALEPVVNYGREFAARRGEEADARREANLQAFRDQQQERMTMEQEMGEAPQRMPTPRPAAPARRAAAPAAREISADRLNDLMMGAEPANAEERVAQMRMRGRQRELEERGTAFKKGGMVKPKAAPKKMMKGGMVAKPKVAAKSKAKPMPFKKGGVIKKGRK